MQTQDVEQRTWNMNKEHEIFFIISKSEAYIIQIDLFRCCTFITESR